MSNHLNQILVDVNFEIPFEFKQINKEDFQGYNISDKVYISPRGGYISDSLNEVFDYEDKNTFVLNGAVGQGKSYAINNIAKKYYDSDDFIVLVIVPFKTLINQYKDNLIKLGIPEEEIFDYQLLSKYEQPHKRKVFLITINSLLGNFGNKSVIQNKLKRDFLENLINECKRNYKKAVFFIDEVHDSIHNFRELFIFNLLKWKDIVHKIVVSSATFNETSKIVIKYLAELTDYNIKIVECDRVIEREKVSDLHLVFIQQHSKFNSKNRQFLNLLERELERGRKIDILTYSKKLAENFTNKDSEVYELFNKHNREINLCTSNRKTFFDDTKCNIGTNFKTGISIESNVSSFFVILPPIDYKESHIFNDGINSLIQALARPRKQAEIYLILPFPKELIKPANESYNYLNELRKVRGNHYQAYNLSYYSLNQQNELLNEFYELQKINYQLELEHIENTTPRTNKPRISFPPFEVFAMEFGEKYLSTQFEIFGKNIVSYAVWAAFNNQFFNCRLKSVFGIDFINLKEGEIQKGLEKIFRNYIPFESDCLELKSDKQIYNFLKEVLFSGKVKVMTKEGEDIPLTEGTTNNKFHRHILSFIQRIKSSEDVAFNRKFYPNGDFDLSGKILPPFDYEFTKEDYIKSSMSVSLNDDYLIENKTERELVSIYRDLTKVFDVFKSKYVFKDKNDIVFLLSDSDMLKYNIIENDDYSLFCQIINQLKEKDENLKLFSFFQNFDSTKTDKSKKSIYSFFKKLFFEVEEGRVNSEKFIDTKKANVIIREIHYNYNNSSLNLIYEPENAWLYQSGYNWEIEGFTYEEAENFILSELNNPKPANEGFTETPSNE